MRELRWKRDNKEGVARFPQRKAVLSKKLNSELNNKNIDSPLNQPSMPHENMNHHGNYEVIITSDVGLLENCVEPAGFRRSSVKSPIVALFRTFKLDLSHVRVPC